MDDLSLTIAAAVLPANADHKRIGNSTFSAFDPKIGPTVWPQRPASLQRLKEGQDPF